MARLAGLEPTASASAGLRSIQLSYKRNLYLPCLLSGGIPIDTAVRYQLVPKERFELSRPCGHYALNVARLPFRHFGMVGDTGFEPVTSAMSTQRSNQLS